MICGLATLLLRSAAEAVARRQELLVAACYVANWPALHMVDMPVLGHTWSLSLEEQFYLLWPVLLYGMLRLRLRRGLILLLVCAGILATASLRFGLYRWYRASGPVQTADIMRMYCGLDTRADTLLIGCLVGLLATWDLLPKSRRFVFWTGAASLASLSRPAVESAAAKNSCALP